MSLKKALLGATLLALPLAAQAQPVTGLYMGAGVGANWLMESDITLSAAPTGVIRNGTADFNTGIIGLVSLGWGFGNGVRAEAEFSYRQNEVDNITGFSGVPGARVAGDVMTYGFMLNGVYDFHLGGLPLVPYIGLGIGAVIHDYDKVTQNGGGQSVDIRGASWAFAYQAIVGASLPLSQILPGLALTAEYRFLGSLNPEVDGSVSNPGVTRNTAEVENMNHSVLLGLRYAFGAAPAAPAPVVAAAAAPVPAAPARPAAAPAPARTFLIFFDFNSADLTERARGIIAEAATNAGRVGTTRIEVAGHADRSGTPQYNQRLSERRAQAVAAELEARGVPRSAMVVQAFGEERPLVPTADGAREPQNRRVEIVLR